MTVIMSRQSSATTIRNEAESTPDAISAAKYIEIQLSEVPGCYLLNHCMLREAYIKLIQSLLEGTFFGGRLKQSAPD